MATIYRRNFGKIKEIPSMPNLIEIQKVSYEDNFLQLYVPIAERTNKGLQAVLNSIFPINNNAGTATLEFVDYIFEEPKYDLAECKRKGLNYTLPLKITLRLILWDVDRESGTKEILNVKEQKVYMGDIPLMTENGTFVINGIERVVVSQIHRSPGVFFDHDKGKVSASGKLLYSASIIPYRGSWIDFEFDTKDLVKFSVDRKRKLNAILLLKGLGMTSQDIIDFYYDRTKYVKKNSDYWSCPFLPELIKVHALKEDLVNAENGEIVMKAGEKITPRIARSLLAKGLVNIIIHNKTLLGRFLATNVVIPRNSQNDSIILECGEEITEENLALLEQSSLQEINLIKLNCGPYIRNSLMLDRYTTQQEALTEIYKTISSGDIVNSEITANFLQNLFFNPSRYDLSEVGRVKTNERLGSNVPIDVTCLTEQDIKNVLKELIAIKDGKSQVDDIDNLGNRRVRSVGELLENQFRLGLMRIVKGSVERMNTIDLDTVMPYALINPKMLIAVLREFFGTSQFSQFMEQTNPLSEVGHKIRLSALGPGGLNRERAGLEIRDVHFTHDGRICSVETPEGQNIGLMGPLATYARANKHGFIEAPRYKVLNGAVTKEIVYLTATEEARYKVASADANRNSEGKLTDTILSCRYNYSYVLVPVEEVEFIGVSPSQIVSVAASLIPFLENDDASRALMGSNMQRQAVPLITTEAPLVGTGVEKIVARDSGACVIAKNSGTVEYVDSTKIVIKKDWSSIGSELFKQEDLDNREWSIHSAAANLKNFVQKQSGYFSCLVDIYNLTKLQSSNHNTSINQRPTVNIGDRIIEGEIIADGQSIDQGELALGKNVLVAFIPWYGYNFKDSLVISEDVVSDDIFTSVHIEEFEIAARDTRLGPEEITRDIPNVTEEALRHLDDAGIVHIGAQVKAGDILVGKVTPKSESPATAEEKLLRAIFGERAADIKNTSLYVTPGTEGTVVEVRTFLRRGIEKDDRTITIENEQIRNFAKDKDYEVSVISKAVTEKISDILSKNITAKDLLFLLKTIGHTNQHIKLLINDLENMQADSKLDIELLNRLNVRELLNFKISDSSIMEQIASIKSYYEEAIAKAEARFNHRVDNLQYGDELPQSVLKVVKVFIATKRKLQPGDKMAGRHGNKGVIARIASREDMPFLPDGRRIQIIISSLSISSRMNAGQVLETHLGWTSVGIGQEIGKLLEKYNNNNADFDHLKEFLNKVYEGDEENLQKFNQASKEEFIDICEQLKAGIPFATPVFDGAKVATIKKMLKLAGLSEMGQVKLINGITGEFFDRYVTVGYKYMLKLHHLVDDKIHARSIGPYGLVTQQPLGGKAHFGGQRVGEMEYWALEAYGAANLAQEMDTYKSDDILGRIKVYESLVQGEFNFKPSVPESFKVMLKELKALCLNIQLKSSNQDQIELMQQESNYSAPNFDFIKVNIASPEDIRIWSYGEVEKPETINYRTFKPEKKGLFCERIFGPVKDYECSCGKYRKMKYKGVICEKCGVEVTLSHVRRERMGHIELAAPVSHIWFLKSIPSKIGLLLDMSIKDVERILYFENHIVIDPGVTPLKSGELLNEKQLQSLYDKYGEDSFTAMIGAEAIRILLINLDLQEIYNQLQQEFVTTNAEAKKKKIIKRLKLVEDIIASGNKPEWMILTALPIIPPDLRPLVMLDGGRFAASDLNELYRRVINRNNRLKRLIQLQAPEIIVRNEKRMLQESVDALLDNGRRGRRILKGSNKRPFKSLSDMLKGKQGRFRQNLLGKRVDYSGRSVIVSGPELKLDECGLPKQMVLELFKPFLYGRLVKHGLANSIKIAKSIVEEQRPEIWDILADIVDNYLVLLNRAPTLHRPSIQAFKVKIVEGKAIRLHPLVCTAFNADFDGDQMAVHVPLSIEAQAEARILMMSTNNILSPANGRPIVVPDEDIVLGIYYLTLDLEDQIGEGTAWGGLNEIEHALAAKALTLHTRIKYRIRVKNFENGFTEAIVDTTPGRIILKSILPENPNLSFDNINKRLAKKDLSFLINEIYRYCGQSKTVVFVDKLMGLGFKYASDSGISIGMDDMMLPKNKSNLIAKSMQEVKQFEQQYAEGLITYGEKYNKVLDAWSQCTDSIANEMMNEITDFRLAPDQTVSNKNGLNSLFMMAISSARGSATQLKQLCGMKGLMVRPSGEIIEHPIISSFKEGLSSTEYFNSTPGARKGFADMALKTANSGHLARKLIDAAHDVVITNYDCHTENGIVYEPVIEGGEVIRSLADQVLGRCAATSIYHTQTKDLIIAAGDLITDSVILSLEAAGIWSVKTRAIVTCKEPGYGGVCSKCYGLDLATQRIAVVGEAIGIIAAQSISEPGTQLTMKTFHIGGAVTRRSENSTIEAGIQYAEATVRVVNPNIVQNSDKFKIVMSRLCEIVLLDANGHKRINYKVPYGAKLLVEDNQKVTKGMRLAEWDPYTTPIITEKSGKAIFRDVVEGISIKTVTDDITGITTKIITESRQKGHKNDLKPCIELFDAEDRIMILSNGLEARYYLPVNAILSLENSNYVHAGDILAKIPKENSKVKDITGGLPRVVELFEARKHKDHAIIAELDGNVEFGKDYKTKRSIILHSNSGQGDVEYIVSKNKHIAVNDGDFVQQGDVIVEGTLLLQDILRVKGLEAFTKYMINEVQSVYHVQGVKIDNKHIEVITRQMLRKVQVLDPGDTTLLTGEILDKLDIIKLNQTMVANNKNPAQYQLVVQGITRAALQTKSFISAASFQETTRVLTDAALAGKEDYLLGLKENVIVGRIIPVGTGFHSKKNAQAEAAAEAERANEIMNNDVIQEDSLDSTISLLN